MSSSDEQSYKQSYKVVATHKTRGTKVIYKDADNYAHHGFDDGGAHVDSPKTGKKYEIEPIHEDATPPAKMTGLGVGLVKAKEKQEEKED